MTKPTTIGLGYSDLDELLRRFDGYGFNSSGQNPVDIQISRARATIHKYTVHMLNLLRWCQGNRSAIYDEFKFLNSQRHKWMAYLAEKEAEQVPVLAEAAE